MFVKHTSMFLNNRTTARTRNAVRVNVIERRTPGQQSRYIRKVKVTRVFPRCQREFQTNTENQRCTACFKRGSPKTGVKTFAEIETSESGQNVFIMLSSELKTQPKFPPSLLCYLLKIVHFPAGYLLHLPALYFAFSLPLPEGRESTGQEISEQ